MLRWLLVGGCLLDVDVVHEPRIGLERAGRFRWVKLPLKSARVIRRIRRVVSQERAFEQRGSRSQAHIRTTSVFHCLAS